MGGFFSRGRSHFVPTTRYVLDVELIEELRMQSSLTSDQILRLFSLFIDFCDPDPSGLISVVDLARLPAFSNNPLLGRIVDVFLFIKSTKSAASLSSSSESTAPSVARGTKSAPSKKYPLSAVAAASAHPMAFVPAMRLGFRDFVFLADLLSPTSSSDDRARFLFCIYDHDADGLVGRKDIVKTLQRCFGNVMQDAEIERAASKVLEELTGSADSPLTYEDFSKSVHVEEIAQHLSVQFW